MTFYAYREELRTVMFVEVRSQVCIAEYALFSLLAALSNA